MKKTASTVLVRKRDESSGEIIKAKGRLVLPPRREIWRLQWDEYIDSRMKQFTVR